MSGARCQEPGVRDQEPGIGACDTALGAPILIFHKRGRGGLEPGSWLPAPAKAAVCASLLPNAARPLSGRAQVSAGCGVGRGIADQALPIPIPCSRLLPAKG
jgi:hypothetical protein